MEEFPPGGPYEDPGTLRDQIRMGSGQDLILSVSGKHILVAEDDLSLARRIANELQSRDFVVDTVHDGEAALALLTGEHRYDLLILDLNLPKLAGMSLLRRIKLAQPRLPALALTAPGGVVDRVQALLNGADDCLTKPFVFLEFLARVQAVLRRNSGVNPNCSSVGDLTLYRDERRAERNGRSIILTPREFSILDLMMRNAGQPVSRETLLREVWNRPPDDSTNVVDVYMKYIRDKVDGPGEAKLTRTVRGVGYELREA